MALTFNVKPAGLDLVEPRWKSETFPEASSPIGKNQNDSMPKKDLQPAVDTYAEWDTWDTINAVKNALECFHDVTLIEADQSAVEKLKEKRPDIVFNIAEGFNGVSREAQIPAILDMLSIPYSGSDPLTLSTCLDKARTKEILSYHKILNSKFFVAERLSQIHLHGLNYPLMVKPVSEGSSKGIFLSSYVKNEDELRKEVQRILSEYGQGALVEEFLPGREFTAAIIGNADEAEVLPIVEINYEEFPDGFTPIYSYEAKWIIDTKENPLEVFTCPAHIGIELEEKIKASALSAYRVLRCRDWSRIDIRLDASGEPNIIEVNPLPGILPDVKENSCFPKAARTAGLGYNEMINKVLYVAAKRHNLI